MTTEFLVGTTSGRVVPSALEGITHHCLEKNPQRRFQSAQDLAFNLEQFTHPSTSGYAPAMSGSSRSQLTVWRLFLAAAVTFAVGAAFFVGRRSTHSSGPSFQQITFQRGRLLEARFSADGQTIVYSAEWNGQPSGVYTARSDRPGSRSLDLKGAKLLSVSRAGDVAVQLNSRTAGTFVETGTLAVVALSGGSPREVATDVQYADFSPDGSQFAIVRDVGPRTRLEYPVGKSLLETTNSLTDLRISPGGDKIAFLQRLNYNDTHGVVAVVDASGHEKLLTKEKYEVMDLAWSPPGDEIWFTVSDRGTQRSIHAVSMNGVERVLLEVPGNIILKDVLSDGRALLVRDSVRRELAGLIAGEAKERDFSWLDWTYPGDISSDGTFFVFHEGGVGGGENYSLFMRKLDGSPPVLLGEGSALSVSSDRKFVLASHQQAPSQLFLVPLGPGQTHQITNDSIDHRNGFLLPGGKQLIFVGIEPGHSPRWYLQSLQAGSPKPLTSEGFRDRISSISPDGKFFPVTCPDGKPCLASIDGGEPKPIPGIDVEDKTIQWTDDGRAIYVFRYGSLPARIERLEVATGKRTLWKTVAPADTAGVHGITEIRMTREARVCLYSYLRTSSDLFIVKGLGLYP